ncbi:MAG: hypothetical protein WKF75_02525 [Singulisphaera sp.]
MLDEVLGGTEVPAGETVAVRTAIDGILGHGEELVRRRERKDSTNSWEVRRLVRGETQEGGPGLAEAAASTSSPTSARSASTAATPTPGST